MNDFDKLTAQDLQNMLIQLCMQLQGKHNTIKIIKLLNRIDNPTSSPMAIELDAAQQEQFDLLVDWYQWAEQQLEGSNVYKDRELLSIKEAKTCFDVQKGMLMHAMSTAPAVDEDADVAPIEKSLRALVEFAHAMKDIGHPYLAMQILVQMNQPYFKFKNELAKLDIEDQTKAELMNIAEFYYYIAMLNKTEVSESETRALTFLNLQRRNLIVTLAKIYFSDLNKDVALPTEQELSIALLSEHFKPKVSYHSIPGRYDELEEIIAEIFNQVENETLNLEYGKHTVVADQALVYKAISLNDLKLLHSAFSNVLIMGKDIINDEGMTPLMHACALGNFPAIQYLITVQQVDVFATDPKTRMQAIHHAAAHDHDAIVAFLVRHGASATLEAECEKGNASALVLMDCMPRMCDLAAAGDTEGLSDLQVAFAINASDEAGKSIFKACLEKAVIANQQETVKLITKRFGYEMNRELAESYIMHAALNSNLAIMKLIVEKSKFSFANDDFGKTLLDISRGKENKELEAYLNEQIPSAIFSVASNSYAMFTDTAQVYLGDAAGTVRNAASTAMDTFNSWFGS